MLTREVALLQHTPLFSKLPLARLKLLAYAGEEMMYEAGEFLFRCGETSDAAFVILEGEVEASVPDPEEDVVIGHFGPRDLIGEVGVFTGNKRTVTMRAKVPTTVLRVPAQVITELVRDCPACAASITAFMAETVERLIDRFAVTASH